MVSQDTQYHIRNAKDPEESEYKNPTEDTNPGESEPEESDHENKTEDQQPTVDTQEDCDVKPDIGRSGRVIRVVRNLLRLTLRVLLTFLGTFVMLFKYNHTIKQLRQKTVKGKTKMITKLFLKACIVLRTRRKLKPSLTATLYLPIKMLSQNLNVFQNFQV